MKKIILNSLFFLAVASSVFSRNESTAPIQEENKPIISPESIVTIPEKEDVLPSTSANTIAPISHWSLGIKGGVNYFRLAASTLNRSYQYHLLVGGTLEYTINPLVGVGLEYTHNPFGCTTPTIVITGGTKDAILYGSINLSNLLIPNRTGKSKFNVYGDGGVGTAFYNFSLNQGSTQTDLSSMAILGLKVEYSISKSLSLGLEGQYRYYNWKLEQVNTIYNTEAATATIGLRYKINAAGKKQHVRNISISDYYPKPVPVITEKIVKENTDETLNRLNALEAENAALNSKLNKINENIQSLTNKENPFVDASFQNIEFEFGSDKLDVSAYKILDQIADILIHNSASVKLNVAGYTDYIGSAEFNRILSVKRANAVKDYLVAKNVPTTKISIFGYGKDNPIAPNISVVGRQKNRRVEFQFAK
ncbi:MAG: OmpA family protein [Paludibacter sp.]|nr:OmpA family protein [Paludibacter sp.]